MIGCSRRRFVSTCLAATCGTLALAGSTSARAGDPASGESTPQWPFEWQVGEFFFHCDFDPRARQQMVDELRRLRTDLSAQLGIRIEDELIHLILFSTAAQYRGYMREYFPEIPERRALFIKRRGPGMVFAYDNREMEIDLRHETTHAMLNASLAYVPLWLDEGLAEYFEVVAEDRMRGSGHMKMTRFRGMLGQVREMTELEDLGDLADMGGSEYRDAWSWVHFLLHHSDSTRQVLTRFLQDIQSGMPPGALSRRLAAAVPDYRTRYVSHFRSRF